MATYKIKESVLKKVPASTTLVNGERVELIRGPYTAEVLSAAGIPIKVSVRAATQADLEILYAEGHPFVERVDEPESKKDKA